MHRRAFLTATAAAATAATLKAAHAVTERPLGETGVPLTPSRPPPLGPLPGSRYPDPHIENQAWWCGFIHFSILAPGRQKR